MRKLFKGYRSFMAHLCLKATEISPDPTSLSVNTQTIPGNHIVADESRKLPLYISLYYSCCFQCHKKSSNHFFPNSWHRKNSFFFFFFPGDSRNIQRFLSLKLTILYVILCNTDLFSFHFYFLLIYYYCIYSTDLNESNLCNSIWLSRHFTDNPCTLFIKI